MTVTMASNQASEDVIKPYANPNYSMYHDDGLYAEVQVEDGNLGEVPAPSTSSIIPDLSTPEKQRKKYAQMDLTSMGINPSWSNTPKSGEKPFDNSGNEEMLDYYSTVQVKTGEDCMTDVSPTLQSTLTPDSTDSGIQTDSEGGSYKHGPVTDDIYAVVQKKRPSDKVQTEEKETNVGSEVQPLPPGWERHEDDDGAYYWHIKSGTIQREPPSPVKVPVHTSTSLESQPEEIPDLESSSEENHLKSFEEQALKIAEESLQCLELDNFTNSSSPFLESPSSPNEKPIRYAVRSLGWVPILEADLTPENSSKAVNRCIMDLSGRKRDLNDAIGVWGDGKDLYMDLNHSDLKLINPIEFTELHSQPISSIRVWGVGRDNGRDFAYVARDRVTRQHMCHVFRCDTPARHIANTLRDICKQIIMDRNQKGGSNAMRPSNLPNLNGHDQNNHQHSIDNIIKNTTFPTPMDEPNKIVKCHYLGMASVHRAVGMEVLNQAIDRVFAKVPAEKWAFVDVTIAPSTITVSEHKKAENVLAECRVRFLSFMGISNANVKLMAFILSVAQNQFVCHVFHCEPSAGALCKTVEAACKLRYQKCLDAHGPNPEAPKKDQPKKGIGTVLKQGVQSVLGGIGKKKSTKS